MSLILSQNLQALRSGSIAGVFSPSVDVSHAPPSPSIRLRVSAVPPEIPQFQQVPSSRGQGGAVRAISASTYNAIAIGTLDEEVSGWRERRARAVESDMRFRDKILYGAWWVLLGRDLASLPDDLEEVIDLANEMPDDEAELIAAMERVDTLSRLCSTLEPEYDHWLVGSCSREVEPLQTFGSQVFLSAQRRRRSQMALQLTSYLSSPQARNASILTISGGWHPIEAARDIHERLQRLVNCINRFLSRSKWLKRRKIWAQISFSAHEKTLRTSDDMLDSQKPWAGNRPLECATGLSQCGLYAHPHLHCILEATFISDRNEFILFKDYLDRQIRLYQAKLGLAPKNVHRRALGRKDKKAIQQLVGYIFKGEGQGTINESLTPEQAYALYQSARGTRMRVASGSFMKWRRKNDLTDKYKWINRESPVEDDVSFLRRRAGKLEIFEGEIVVRKNKYKPVFGRTKSVIYNTRKGINEYRPDPIKVALSRRALLAQSLSTSTDAKVCGRTHAFRSPGKRRERCYVVRGANLDAEAALHAVQRHEASLFDTELAAVNGDRFLWNRRLAQDAEKLPYLVDRKAKSEFECKIALGLAPTAADAIFVPFPLVFCPEEGMEEADVMMAIAAATQGPSSGIYQTQVVTPLASSCATPASQPPPDPGLRRQNCGQAPP